MHRAILIGFVAALPTACFAQGIPDRFCTLEGAIGRLQMAQTGRAVESSKAQVALSRELEAILNTLPPSHRPSLESLSSSQAARYSEIKAQQQSINLNELVDSGLARDADELGKMYRLTWASYINQPPRDVPAADDARLIFGLLHNEQPDIDMQPPDVRPVGWSISDRLLVGEFDAARRIDDASAITANGMATLNRLTSRYPKPFVESSLSEEDSREYGVALSQIAPTRKEARLIEDLRGLASYWAMAQLVNQDRIQDLRAYGPMIQSIGNTIEQQIPSFAPAQYQVFQFWQLIDQKEPSDKMKEIAEIVHALDTSQVATK